MNQLFTLPPKLTEQQMLVYEAVQNLHRATALDAAHELHAWANCHYCTFGERYVPCRFAEQNGRAVLEALRKKGLLRRDVHHVYRVDVDSAGLQTDVIPF